MKKALAVILIASLFLCGCGGGKTPALTEAPVEETVIADNDMIRFTITGSGPKSGGYEYSCVCENKTENNVLFIWEDVSVDGTMRDPFWSCRVVAGKKAESTLHFDVQSAQEVEFTLIVMNEVGPDTYDYPNAIFRETFSYK